MADGLPESLAGLLSEPAPAEDAPADGAADGAPASAPAYQPKADDDALAAALGMITAESPNLQLAVVSKDDAMFKPFEMPDQLALAPLTGSRGSGPEAGEIALRHGVRGSTGGQIIQRGPLKPLWAGGQSAKEEKKAPAISKAATKAVSSGERTAWGLALLQKFRQNRDKIIGRPARDLSPPPPVRHSKFQGIPATRRMDRSRSRGR